MDITFLNDVDHYKLDPDGPAWESTAEYDPTWSSDGMFDVPSLVGRTFSGKTRVNTRGSAGHMTVFIDNGVILLVSRRGKARFIKCCTYHAIRGEEPKVDVRISHQNYKHRTKEGKDDHANHSDLSTGFRG